MKDFFISYTKADRSIALAIQAWIVGAGFTTVMQATDFHAGSNFVLQMDDAIKNTHRTIAILSEDYLSALFTQPEWAAAFAKDPTGANGLLIPLRVKPCKPVGILATVVYVDLVGMSFDDMERAIIERIKRKSASSGAVAPKRRKKRASEDNDDTRNIVMKATGPGSIQSGRDTIITEKHVTVAGPVVPQAHHITDDQAQNIQELLKKLGERDLKAGKGNQFAHWQSEFKKRRWAGKGAEKITSYKLLPASDYDSAVAWIKKEIAISRPGLRRTQNDAWRKEQYGKIWACAKTAGMSHDEVHEFAQTYLELKKPVLSLTDLGERNLEALAGAMYRRANSGDARNAGRQRRKMIREIMIEILAGRIKTKYEIDQIPHLFEGIASVLDSKKIRKDADAPQVGRDSRLDDEDERIASEVFDDLIHERVIVPGLDRHNSLPFFRIHSEAQL